MAEKNKWKEGSPEKIALHAAVGAVVSSITKGNISSGALAGGATEYLAKVILEACQGDKAKAQWVALIVGAAIGEVTGRNPQIGALIAFNAIKNNNGFLSEEDKEKIEEVLNTPEFQEELRRHRKDGKLPPNFVGVVVSQLDKGPEAKSVYGEIGVLPLISAGVSKTVDISDNLKKIRAFIINNQTTQGRSIADEIVPQGS